MPLITRSGGIKINFSVQYSQSLRMALERPEIGITQTGCLDLASDTCGYTRTWTMGNG